MQQLANLFIQKSNRSYRAVLYLLIIIILSIIILCSYIYFSAMEKYINCFFRIKDVLFYKLVSQNNKLDKNVINVNCDLFIEKSYKPTIKINNYSYKYIISKKDTLKNILTQYGVNNFDIIKLTKQYSVLRDLQKGQSLSWIVTINKNLQNLTWKKNDREIYIYNYINGYFQENIIDITGEWRNFVLIGKLNDSFIKSAYAAGLINSDINTIIKILQWKINFNKFCKRDKFSVVVSRKILKNKHTHSQLLGIRLYTGGRNYYAFRAENGQFYDKEATKLTPSFIRFPTIKRFRISSRFNSRRLNPVTGRIVSHRGVDFAVPLGTLVLAVSDGEVTVSKKDVVAGNYIVVHHDSQYITRYMHLNKIFVKRGQEVKRGDPIALSGNTGRSTGPHLHFEVWINRRAVNPLTAKLPYVQRLNGKSRIKYLLKIKQILPQLQFN